MSFIIDRTLEIDAPADVVWEVISDLPRYGEWNPFCIAVKSTLKPGDPIDMQVKLMSRPQFQREFMIHCEPGQGFAYRMKPVPGGALSSHRSHAITAVDAQSSRYRSYFHMRGWLLPLVGGLLGRRLQAGFAGMNQGVKQRAERLWAERRRAA